MTDLENQGKKPLNESRRIAECPPEMAQTSMTPQASEGTPVSVNVNMTAAGKEHVDDLLSMMKAAGLDQAEPMKPDMMPMRTDMERLRGIVDEPEMEDEDDLDEYENEPDYEYSDHEYMTHDLSGGINRPKNSYADAEDGDNAMAVEADDDDELSKKLFPKFKPGELDKMSRDKNRKMNQKRFMKPGKPKRSGEWSTYESDSEDEMKEAIRSSLMKALAEKKSKPDYIDLDKDGDKKEPMKKAAKDAKKKKTNEGMPSSVIKYKQKLANMPDDELAQKLSGKSDDELRMMARRHGYGKDTDHYINRTKKTNEAAPSSRLAKIISQAYGAMADMGDSGLDYLDDHAPLYDKLMNKHNNDLDRIIAKEKPPVLLKLAKELESVVDSAGFEMESTEEADINRLAKRIR